MERSVRFLLPWQLVVGAFACVSAQAQDTSSTVLVVEARVQLRRDPSTKRPPIVSIPRGDSIQLVGPPAFVSDFYHVATRNRDTGWVAFPYVRAPDAPAISASVAAAAFTQVADLTNPAPSIVTTWQKPRAIGSTFVTAIGRRCKAGDVAGASTRFFRKLVRQSLPSAPSRGDLGGIG